MALRFLIQWLWRVIVASSLAAILAWWLMNADNSPLPDAWNPLLPLDVAAPVTPLTATKLRRALESTAACYAALTSAASFEPLDPLIAEGGCGINPRLRLSQLGDVAMVPVETTCAIALRLAMWERHVVQPAARAQFASAVTRIRHQSSYNCRAVRTESGDGLQLSTHATAQAIDIAGVTLADGRQLELLDNWQGETPEAAFFRALHTGACDWFVTVLGPDFNALHADHFHMQSVGWGSCR